MNTQNIKKLILWYLRGNKYEKVKDYYNYGGDFFSPVMVNGNIIFHPDGISHITPFDEVISSLTNGYIHTIISNKNFTFSIDNYNRFDINFEHDGEFSDVDEEVSFHTFLIVIREMLVVCLREHNPNLEYGIIQTIRTSLNKDGSTHYDYYSVYRNEYIGEDVPIIRTIEEVHHLTKTIHNTYSGGELSWWAVYSAFKPTFDLPNRLGINGKFAFSNWLNNLN